MQEERLIKKNNALLLGDLGTRLLNLLKSCGDQDSGVGVSMHSRRISTQSQPTHTQSIGFLTKARTIE